MSAQSMRNERNICVFSFSSHHQADVESGDLFAASQGIHSVTRTISTTPLLQPSMTGSLDRALSQPSMTLHRMAIRPARAVNNDWPQILAFGQNCI